jgi:SAM-dependent methyltransferase
MTSATAAEPGLLGDTPERDYSRKLQLFNAFAEPELRQAIAGLSLEPGMRILDAGCGTGEALQWLSQATHGRGELIGIDLSLAHVSAARTRQLPNVTILHGDLQEAPVAPQSLDLLWCVNTINHLRDPLRGARRMRSFLRPGGSIALGQSSLLPDMFFAWDARLERLTNEAVREYYRQRYRLEERDLTAVRNLVGLLHQAGFRNIAARTLPIERIQPLRQADRDYLLEAIFRATWGERLRPYLSADDFAELTRLTDPDQPQFALRRVDFHFVQSFTLVTGQAGT